MPKRIISSGNPAEMVLGQWHNIPDVQNGQPVKVTAIDQQRTQTRVIVQTKGGDYLEVIMVAMEVVKVIEKAIPFFEKLWVSIKKIFRK
jgi:hypothetical protein